ncbi:protein of unknown function nitrogen fixation [Gloeothece citriformis PCC 7424]|uniref:Nif11 domain-containing protein n=1 Tax=Gloeothece citriformis (strain PCC 7424) TaxID=65393 RepID=B7KC70_GLOC7|nr:Nif11-like leader peptide family natural product precursor [Gloeothece citriformis]ACK68893.1 protein of unknown function nitrogen fixation [Gloeothece citriformis PCC 7424]
MSLQNVEAFYQRMTTDPEFSNQVQQAKTSEERIKVIRNEGYYFTQEEFDEYTDKFLMSKFEEGELVDLSERELDAVLGGLKGSFPKAIALYGIPPYLY